MLRLSVITVPICHRTECLVALHPYIHNLIIQTRIFSLTYDMEKFMLHQEYIKASNIVSQLESHMHPCNLLEPIIYGCLIKKAFESQIPLTLYEQSKSAAMSN